MPIVTVESGDEEVASDLAKRNALIRRSIREAVLRVSPQTSEDDVIVNFRKCITLVVDPKAADIWIDIDTCPGEMELRANDVADAVAALFPDWGFRASVRRAEVWGPKFHQGPWRAVEVSTGQVLDRVDHPVSRPAPTFDAYFKVVDHVVAQHSKFKLILQVINPVTGEALRLRSDSDEDLRAEYLRTKCMSISHVTVASARSDNLLLHIDEKCEWLGVVNEAVAYIEEVYGVKVQRRIPVDWM